MGLLDGDLAALVGDALRDIFLDATLTRTPMTGSAIDPTPGTPVSYPCKAIHEEWGRSYLTNGLVRSDDRKVLILSTTLGTEPEPGDKITIRGETFTVVPGDTAGAPAIATDPAKAAWVLRARK